MESTPNSQISTLTPNDFTLQEPTLNNGINYVPEPPMEKENEKILDSQVLIPFLFQITPMIF